MPRDLSTDFRRAIAAVAPDDAPLVALEITHPDLAEAIRVVNDSENQTIEGNEFIALPFTAVLPDDREGQAPRARLEIDNVGRALTEPLDRVGGGAGASIRALQVLRGNPRAVEWEVIMDVASVTVDQLTVSVEVGFDPLLGRAAVQLKHDTTHSPGLF